MPSGVSVVRSGYEQRYFHGVKISILFPGLKPRATISLVPTALASEITKIRRIDRYCSNGIYSVGSKSTGFVVYNPVFNYGEFALIKSQAGLNNYKISMKEWVEKTNAIGLKATAGR